MRISAVMDDLGSALDSIQGLRVFAYSVDRITPPAAVVLWPESIAYDQTAGRGSDRITIPVIVLVGRLDQRNARDLLAVYMDGEGPHSVKAAIDGHEATAYDTARVTTGTPDTFQSAGVEYLGASFEIDVFGRGAV